MILAIDPGSTQSAYVILDKHLQPDTFDKIDNKELLNMIYNHEFEYCNHIAIEMIASYGMAVGAEVFDTCVFIGQLKEALFATYYLKSQYIYRKDEKMNLCHTMKAKDTNIRQALIDRFAQFDFKNGKGTKKNQDVFYGFAKDCWAAYAVAITYYDLYLNKKE